MNYFYKVICRDKNGVERLEEIEADNPGNAFATCQKLHPDSKMIKAYIEGKIGVSEWYNEWLPPKVQRDPVKNPRPPRALRKNERGCEFPFYDQVARKEA